MKEEFHRKLVDLAKLHNVRHDLPPICAENHRFDNMIFPCFELLVYLDHPLTITLTKLLALLFSLGTIGQSIVQVFITVHAKHIALL